MTWTSIARRDFGSLFRTPVGFVVFAVLFALAGGFWVAMVYTYAESSADLVFQPYASSTFTINDHLLGPWFSNLVILLMLVAPGLAMRAFAEESRQGTLDLLRSAPIPTWEIVLGKYVGVVGGLTVVLGAVGLQPLSLLWFGQLDLWFLASGLLGCWLVGVSVIAWTLFWSASTDNQLVALLGGFAGAMGLWIVAWIDPDPTSWASRLSLATHAEESLRGSLRISDLVWFAAFNWLWLVLTWLRVEALRWPE